MDVLQRELVAGVTVLQVLVAAAAFFAAAWVMNLIRGSKRQQLVPKRCSACNWKGAVGAGTHRCPSCGAGIS